MKKIELRIKWRELGGKTLECLQLIGFGLVAFLSLVTIIPLVAIANVFIRLGDKLKDVITDRPVPSVAVTFAIMLVVGVFSCILTYAHSNTS